MRCDAMGPPRCGIFTFHFPLQLLASALCCHAVALSVVSAHPAASFRFRGAPHPHALFLRKVLRKCFQGNGGVGSELRAGTIDMLLSSWPILQNECIASCAGN